MSVSTAVSQLLEIEDIRKQNVYSKDTIAIGLARVGSRDQKVVAGTMEELLEVDMGNPLHSLVIPGKMHFLEADAVKQYAVNKETFEKYAEVIQH